MMIQNAEIADLKMHQIRVAYMPNTNFLEGSSGTWDLTKQIKMYIIPHLGQSNAMYQERLGTAWLSSSPVREDLEVTRNVRSNGSQWCAYCQWCKLYIGLLFKKGVWQIVEMDYPCLL